MSSKHTFSLTTLFGVVAITGLIFGCSFWFVSNRKWEELSIPYEECQQIIREAKPLLNEIELFKDNNGRYPLSFAELEKEPFQEFDDLFEYRRVGEEYQIQRVTVEGLTDSYDAIFYRPSHDYPESWRKTNKVIEMGQWRYVIGAQTLE